MDIVIVILKVMFAFGFMIGIHEFGHALAAWRVGVPVRAFSIGIGPGIVFKNVPIVSNLRISPLMFGGYVLMDEDELNRKSLGSRMFVLSAGMIMNVLSAIILFIISGYGAVKAIVLSLTIWIAGWPITGWMLADNSDKVINGLAGPVGITSGVATGSLLGNDMSYITMLAILHVSIAMFNLLPIPPLDGGRMFIYILETFAPKKLVSVIGNSIERVGIAALLLFMVFVTYKDIVRLFE